MRLISLAASEPTFKTIFFNKTGASFILAKQDNPEQSDKSKTYNGVGKSLLVSLIDFCLGTKTGSKITKSLQLTLPDWHFILDVEIGNRSYTIVRHTNIPKYIDLNDEELTLNDFCSKLEKLCFDIPPKFQYLSFRSLLPFFIRPSKQSYISYDDPTKAGTPYQKQLYNAFLLGLDVTFSQTKMLLKKQIDDTEKLYKNIKNDPILKQFFEGYKDSSLALADLNEKIETLELDLQKFEVADDYYQIKQEADAVKNNLDKTQNKIKLRSINIDSINQSLKISSDVNRNDIQKIYDESKLVFHSDVEKKLIDLEKFYQDLTINRTKRLQSQKHEIISELKELEAQFTNLKEELDSHMKFLNAHQALDVFTKMSSRLAEFQQNREKLQGYEKLQHDYEQKKTSLKKEMILQSEETSTYLDQVKNDINEIMEDFRMLVKRFYPNALAGITVRNNDNKNQIRYDIEAKIQSDSSDGINSVKLFCYDLTLLTHGSNHFMDFMFHDSRLFSDIDEVHCNVLFEIVKTKFTDKQYIASINQNQLNALSPDMQKFVNDHLVRELTDDSDGGKLLGITVELEYD
ncbi:hypothetical protein BAZOLSSOX_878 [uncultured Gammaproteobacteria bacterium]|jgi:uncharacterized protein YydD (DUF2326 family)|nr:hypothetical protein [uncultured Gammaproteobacteria bacterium]VVH58321.1 hypothetical protein BAZOLSSOX_878 [uncultured Gammaproteobacteria bacterium]